MYDKVDGFRDMVCSGYIDMRKGKDLTDDNDFVKYFQMVIKKRMDED